MDLKLSELKCKDSGCSGWHRLYCRIITTLKKQVVQVARDSGKNNILYKKRGFSGNQSSFGKNKKLKGRNLMN